MQTHFPDLGGTLLAACGKTLAGQESLTTHGIVPDGERSVAPGRMTRIETRRTMKTRGLILLTRPMTVFLAITVLVLGPGCAGGPPLDPGDLDSRTLVPEARKAMKAGEYDNAVAYLAAVLGRPEDHPHHEEALYLKAVCYHRQASYSRAFNAFKRYVGAHPLSRYKVEKELFKMGQALIQGANSGFLGIPGALGLTLEGTEVLSYLIRISRTGEHAAHAQSILAQYHFDLGHFDLAQIEYQALLDDHPTSEWVPLAEYRVPLCRLLQSQGAMYDRKLLEDALRGFQEFEQKHPEGERVKYARKYARRVHDMLAEKNYRNARLYLSDKRVLAGVFYFQQTIQDYPETEWARKAVEGLREVQDGYPGTEAARAAKKSLELIKE